MPPPSRDLDGFALAMPFIIAAFMLFIGSRFFLTAGMQIDLPSGFPDLCSHLQSERAVAINGANHFVYGDMLLDGVELEKKLRANGQSDVGRRRVLLLYCGRRTALDGLLRAAEIAKRCGFDAVQIAIAETQ